MTPHVEQVIICEEREGDGTPASPIRGVKRVYTLGGDLIAERDDWRYQMLVRLEFNEDKDYAKRTTH
jgi:hypothetical protein